MGPNVQGLLPQRKSHEKQQKSQDFLLNRGENKKSWSSFINASSPVDYEEKIRALDLTAGLVATMEPTA